MIAAAQFSVHRTPSRSAVRPFVIVLQSNVGSTVTASRDRILGTLIGAALGFSFSLFGALPWNYILAVLAAILICGLLGFTPGFGVIFAIAAFFLGRIGVDEICGVFRRIPESDPADRRRRPSPRARSRG